MVSIFFVLFVSLLYYSYYVNKKKKSKLSASERFEKIKSRVAKKKF